MIEDVGFLELKIDRIARWVEGLDQTQTFDQSFVVASTDRARFTTPFALLRKIQKSAIPDITN